MDPILAEVYSTVLPAAPFVIGAYVASGLRLLCTSSCWFAAPSAPSAISMRFDRRLPAARKSSSRNGEVPRAQANMESAPYSAIGACVRWMWRVIYSLAQRRTR